MRQLTQSDHFTQVARIGEYCDDSTEVRSKKLPQRRNREQLMLRELLRAVRRAVRWQASPGNLKSLHSHLPGRLGHRRGSAWGMITPPCRHSDPLDQPRNFSTEQDAF
jgi:hypothetical protein